MAIEDTESGSHFEQAFVLSVFSVSSVVIKP